MNCLRHIAPVLCLVLALVVGGEMTDVLPCVDAECSAWSTGQDSGTPPPAGGDGAGGSATTCICHAAFVSTARVPAVPVRAHARAEVPVVADDAGPSLAGGVPHPPPRR